jgi:hypothetical protein
VVVLDCVQVLPDTPVDEALLGDIRLIDEKTKDAGEKMNKLGFDQFMLDPDKTGI